MMEQSFSLRSHSSPSGRPVSCWHCVTLGRCPNLSSLLAHWGVCMGVWGVVQSPWLIKCCCWVNQSCPTLCDPMDHSKPGFPVLHHLLELAQTHVHWVSDAIQPSHPVVPFSSCLQSFPASGSFLMSWLLATPGAQSIWSFSFSISPSNEYSGLISFRINWFDLTAVQGTLKSLLKHHNSKHQLFGVQPSLGIH